MDTHPNPVDVTSAERAALPHAREAEMIAEAEAQYAAGLFIEEEDVDAWIDSLGTDHELPVPKPKGKVAPV